jgi:hypothetical protein
MLATSQAARGERPRNPAILSAILLTVKSLESMRKEPTFNTILHELSARRILEFHRSLRRYLDLLVYAKVLTVKSVRTTQPNIHEKQVYHIAARYPIVEAGERSLLFRGLNWNIPSPMSVSARTDLEGLALSTISDHTVYSSLEDAIVQSLKVLPKRYPRRAPELTVFATALLATQNVDFDYLLRRAKEAGVVKEIVGILLEIDDTLASASPDVEDIRTLYELRKNYYHMRKPLQRSLEYFQVKKKETNRRRQIVRPNEIVEYAGKQLGIRG